MKKMKSLFVLSLCSVLILLVGCIGPCYFKDRRDDKCQCGTCMRHRCDAICDKCAVKGPLCTACWECQNNHECGDTYTSPAFGQSFWGNKPSCGSCGGNAEMPAMTAVSK